MSRSNSYSTYLGALVAVLSIFLVPAFAHAHPGHGGHGFASGMVHPICGMDHICAMLAVGLWAAQRGGRATWIIPLTFVGVMAFGGFLGIAGVTLPYVQQGILLSVLILGVMVAAAIRLPLVASALIVGLFAFFHGHAHGTEMPQAVSSLAYGAGFMTATALLHGCGIGLAMLVAKFGEARLVRLAGVTVALCGVYLWIA